MVVQSAKDRQRKNGSDRLHGSGYWCILGYRQVRSGRVVILRIRAEHIVQVLFAEDDDVVEALPSDRADQPF
jgi:hypothetical protein